MVFGASQLPTFCRTLDRPSKFLCVEARMLSHTVNLKWNFTNLHPLSSSYEVCRCQQFLLKTVTCIYRFWWYSILLKLPVLLCKWSCRVGGDCGVPQKLHEALFCYFVVCCNLNILFSTSPIPLKSLNVRFLKWRMELILLTSCI